MTSLSLFLAAWMLLDVGIALLIGWRCSRCWGLRLGAACLAIAGAVSMGLTVVAVLR